MSKELIIALQFHQADYDQAMGLARLIADNEPLFRTDVRFLFVNRFDCPAADLDTQLHVVKKFRVENYQTYTKATGWPDGCNAMAVDLLKHIEFKDVADKFDAALLIEPDCIPVQKDWINQLQAEWLLADAIGDTWVMGTWRDGGGPPGHINGNCVVRPDFAARVNLNSIPPGLAWDCAIARQVEHHWFITDLICNRWQETNVSDELMRTPWIGGKRPPVLVHGVKDESAWNYAVRALLS